MFFYVDFFEKKMMKRNWFLVVWCFIQVCLFQTSLSFEFGRLYHYSYESFLDAKSFEKKIFETTIKGHFDVCVVWSSGEDELLRIDYHESDKHGANESPTEFVISHITGDHIKGVFAPAQFKNKKVQSLSEGFVNLLVSRSSKRQSVEQNIVFDEKFDSVFGDHHPISIEAEQQVTLPLFNQQSGLNALKYFTKIFGHLISTSDCSHVRVEAKDVKTALEVLFQKYELVKVDSDSQVGYKTVLKTTNEPPCSQSDL